MRPAVAFVMWKWLQKIEGPINKLSLIVSSKIGGVCPSMTT